MTNNILKISHLNKWFGKKQVLHDLTFDLEKGKVTALIGENGAGKTTIMKTILGISKFSGSIDLNGHAITPSNHKALDSVGALIEYPGLYGYLTGREQLSLFASDPNREEKVDAILKEMEMTSYADQRMSGYSLGMRQKMGIALALVNRPSLVILDEPMNGLDPKANKELRDLILREQAQGISFLISSHILTELQKIADNVVIIDKGKLIAAGTMEQFLYNGNRFFEIQTDDNPKVFELLTKAGYQASSKEESIRILLTDSNLNSLLKLILEIGVNITSISEETADLETSVFNALDGDH